MEKHTQLFHLPKIINKHSTIDSTTSFTSPKTTRGSLQVLLHEVKLQQMCTLKKLQSKKEQGLKKMENSYRIYKEAWKIQKKKAEAKQNIQPTSNELILQQQKKLIASLFKYDTFWKPPHRYKTALAFYDNYLFLYGGFGCQKYMGLTKFSLKSQEWQSPKLQQAQSGEIALYGHTMGVYRQFLYIFGGIRLQSPTNELIQINLKTSQTRSLIEAPYRRKQHAMCFLGKYMIIHGGLQNSYQVKNTLFYFDTESGYWSVPQQYQLPYLSHHSMASISSKSKKKSITLQDYLGDSIYIFGGRNQKDLISNKLYKLKVRQTGELTSEEVLAYGAPEARHSTCLQFIEPKYLCIFGGKSQIQETTQIKKNGIFNDICLFDIDKKQWTYPQVRLQLPFRFGFSSCSVKNRLFIFGGSEQTGYSDGCMLQLKISRGEQQRQTDSSSSARRQ